MKILFNPTNNSNALDVHISTSIFEEKNPFWKAEFVFHQHIEFGAFT